MLLHKHHPLPSHLIPFNIQRPSPLGNPFVMRGESERDLVVEGFGQVLGGRRTPAAVAADHNPPLLVHASSALVTPDKRQETLSKMLTHMIHGQAIGLVCACAPRRCHGEIILEKLKKMYCEIAK